MPKIIFSKVENGDIFTSTFQDFKVNNELEFSTQNITVVYGPNGTGKTSLVNVLSGKKGTKLAFSYEGKKYTKGDELFYIINDQNNRNIINGTAKDFLLGGDIKKEFELQEYVSEEYSKLCNSVIGTLKDRYNISTKSSELISILDYEKLRDIVSDLANKNSKGSGVKINDFINVILSLQEEKAPNYEENKLDFFVKNYPEKYSIVRDLLNTPEVNLECNPRAREIDENNEALKILSKFPYKKDCVVCDTHDIDTVELTGKKTQNKQHLLDQLSPEVMELIMKILPYTQDSDPFSIKESLLRTLETGNAELFTELKSNLSGYKNIYRILIQNTFISLISSSEISEKYNEYNKLLASKPEITDEDLLYIEQIISNSMGKDLKVDRDSNSNIKIFLSDQEFLEKDRKELPLSTGEQNFLSLTFEFLRAKNSPKPIVILDDPISSFDSIYKNKVVFAIVRILQKKQRVILTHNTDLLRLLNCQYTNCFRLYLLNNQESEESGFIQLVHDEQEILINLEKLLSTFRGNISDYITDSRQFLISMIPFIRGYANIIGFKEEFEYLTQVMHGYNTESIDVAAIYKKLFNQDADSSLTSYFLSAEDILKTDIQKIEILNRGKYPLLNKTLRHSLIYLFLRLKVEKVLVEKYKIDFKKYCQLGDIISESFPDDGTIETAKKRVQLTSKKTLINEFNHFEGNLSIFQPAIDITDSALKREVTDILSFLEKL